MIIETRFLGAHLTPAALACFLAYVAVAPPGDDALVRYSKASGQVQARPWTIKGKQWPVPDAVLRSGTLSFTGHATLGTFVGTTNAVSGALAGNADVANVRGWVSATVATLVTGNDHRDRDLRASMEVNKFPMMRFDLDGVTVDSSG